MIEALLNLTDRERDTLKEIAAKRIRYATDHRRKSLGTFQLVWPTAIPVGNYEFSTDEFCTDIISRVHMQQKYKYKQHYQHALAHPVYVKYFGWEFDENYCSSVPELLTLFSWDEQSYRFVRPHDKTDGTRREYRYPLRPIMDGDKEKVISRDVPTPDMPQATTPENLRVPCVFCYSHPESDACGKYRSPAERLVRFRNVNYTLMRYNLLQICPGCLKRDVNHPKHDECLARINCVYCSQPGHHSSLCNSVVAVVARATSSYTDADDHFSPTIVERRMHDDMKVKEEQRRKVSSTRSNIFDLQASDYLSRLSEQAELRRRMRDNECYENVLTQRASERIGGSCIDSPYFDVHCDEYVFAEMSKIQSSIPNMASHEILDKAVVCQKVSGFLTQIEEKLDCGREDCTSGKQAAYFCRCGFLRLCSGCLFGDVGMVFKIQTEMANVCPACHYQIPIPTVPGMTSGQIYLDIVEVLKYPICKLKAGLSNWVITSAHSPNKTDTFKECEYLANLIRKHLACSSCNMLMDSESRVCYKSQCDCGFLICRFCHLGWSMMAYVERKRSIPRCYSVLQNEKVKCRGCEVIIPGFGMCTGLTLLAVVCRIVVCGRDTNLTATLRDLFDDVLKDKLKVQAILTPPPASPIDDDVNWFSSQKKQMSLSRYSAPNRSAKRQLDLNVFNKIDNDVMNEQNDSHPSNQPLHDVNKGSEDLRGAQTSISSSSVVLSEWHTTLVAIDQVVLHFRCDPNTDPDPFRLEDLARGYRANELDGALERLQQFIQDSDLTQPSQLSLSQQSVHTPAYGKDQIAGVWINPLNRPSKEDEDGTSKD